jgi:hypothetical protein
VGLIPSLSPLVKLAPYLALLATQALAIFTLREGPAGRQPRQHEDVDEPWARPVWWMLLAVPIALLAGAMLAGISPVSNAGLLARHWYPTELGATAIVVTCLSVVGVVLHRWRSN